MLVVVIALALVAIYANVQKARHDQIEKAIVTYVAPVTATPAASPSPP